jgi:hypothetical protein
MKKKLLGLICAGIILGGTSAITTASATACLNSAAMDIASGSGTYETCGGDDVTYRIPLVQPVQLGGVTYTDVYATTNSVVTLGRPDPNYSSFPSTPSISLQAHDWVERGWNNNNGVFVNTDEFFNITTIPNGFTVDLLARTFSEYVTNGQISYISQNPGIGLTIDQIRQETASQLTYYGDPANTVGMTPEALANLISYNQDRLDHIDHFTANGALLLNAPVRNTFTFHLNPDNSMSIITFTSSTDVQYRNGCVLSQDAAPVTLEECGILQATSFAEIMEIITQLNAELGADDVVKQQSTIESSGPLKKVSTDPGVKLLVSGSTADLVITGNFVEKILNIDVNQTALAADAWVQTPTSITISAPNDSTGIYDVVLYNGSVPLLEPQHIVVEQK